jgi:hypothetical protein
VEVGGRKIFRRWTESVTFFSKFLRFFKITQTPIKNLVLVCLMFMKLYIITHHGDVFLLSASLAFFFKNRQAEWTKWWFSVMYTCMVRSTGRDVLEKLTGVHLFTQLRSLL